MVSRINPPMRSMFRVTWRVRCEHSSRLSSLMARANCGEAMAETERFGTLTMTAMYVAIAKIPVVSRPIFAVTKKDESVGARTEVTKKSKRKPVYIR